MSHIVVFKVGLTCRACGVTHDAKTIWLATSSFGQDPDNTPAIPGEVMDLEIADFEDGFVRIRDDDPATVNACETWGCKACHRANLAMLSFERVDDDHYRFLDASMLPVTPEHIAEVTFLSRSLEEYWAFPGDDERLLAELVARTLR